MKNYLPNEMLARYDELKDDILLTLKEYAEVPEDKLFYEFCYCICTPQSSAKNASLVQKKLEEIDFFNNEIDPTYILEDRSNYIRFHNQKANRLIAAKEYFPRLREIINSDKTNFEKRNILAREFNGIGLKESSHFLRNIGFRDLAIIDRHLLKHLLKCNVIDEIPKSISPKLYFKIETDFIEFGKQVGISIDELDILFWSYETGFILK